MSIGLALFLVIVGGFAALTVLQAVVRRQARALEGEPVPPLPASHVDLSDADLVLWFHSPSCGPCRAMEPFVEPLVAQGRARSVDVTTDLEVARAFGVMATPTTIRIREGRVLSVRTGGLGPAALADLAS